jgi:hypothetical protein
MFLIRKVPTLVPCVVLSACVFMGPRDGLVVLTGNAPTSVGARCTVALGPVGGSARPQEREVVGHFKESFVVNPNRRGHRASLVCGGGVGVVAERLFKYGRDVDIGGELPLDGHAP